MAVIVSSTIVVNDDLGNGRRWIMERHVDSAGGVHERVYQPSTPVDTAVELAAYAAALEETLIEQDLEDNSEEALS